ncbi:Hypothetical protein R9X50_00086800 [Acrodontium crateriforme]|uniref:Uncharacterized protein n=1 Tax=Acrodontium crateriforme TaxID=150365 RepID=A0AAQ3LYM6_9PEZI|nr:Hypothetical protein R9X50_00086800 [Acrodontium crateriforme]
MTGNWIRAPPKHETPTTTHQPSFRFTSGFYPGRTHRSSQRYSLRTFGAGALAKSSPVQFSSYPHGWPVLPSPDGPWESTRWRDVQYHHGRGYFETARPLQAQHLSAPTAVNPASQSAILSPYAANSPQWWDGRQADYRTLDVSRGPESNAENLDSRSRPQERHSPNSSGNYHLSKDNSPRQTAPTNWRNIPHDHHRSSTDSGDVSLALQIPRGQDLPKITPPFSAGVAEAQPLSGSVSSTSSKATLLPSFASFQEHANRSDEEIDGPEIAPMARRLPCDSCHKLQPMVREVAGALSELDEFVQSICHKSSTRSLEFPTNNPVRAAQWILERLKVAKADLVEFSRKPRNEYPYQPSHLSISAVQSRPVSPATSVLKRSAESWEREEYASKRPRSGDSFAHFQRGAFSPAQTEVTSAFPKPASPMHRIAAHALPSPQSAAPHSSNPMSSPAPSYHTTHTGSTTSTSSAHVADLQHQITLKTLALESLQSEYSSLLQKLQRERVKNQTLEKKATTSSQEINDLTNKSEELAEQVKSLELQLEECEKKKETLSSDAAREKDQWGRMLEMSTRLQSKHADERQKLVEERDYLLRRVDSYEAENLARVTDIRKSPVIDTESPSDVTELKREIGTLKSRNSTLRQALDDMVRQNQSLNDRARDILQQRTDMGGAATRALHDDASTTAKTSMIEASKDSACVLPTFDPPGFKATLQQIEQQTKSAPSTPLPSISSSFSISRDTTKSVPIQNQSSSFAAPESATMPPPPRPAANWQSTYGGLFGSMDGAPRQR